MTGCLAIAVLMNPGTAFHPAVLKSVQAAAQRQSLQAVPVSAASSDEIERGFAKAARERVTAAIVVIDAYFLAQRRHIAEVALKHRIATLTYARREVEAGALICYGTNLEDSFRRAATYVDKILKGATPADFPIEQPRTFALVINRKTAKALGLEIPQELRLRADELID